jgi:hypothetical protein
MATVISLPAGAVGVASEPDEEELGPEFRFVPQTEQNNCSARAAPHWLQTTGI